MKKNITLLAVLFSFAGVLTSCNETKEKEEKEEAVAVAEASAETYIVTTGKSTINWSGNKPTGTHTGTIALANGELSVENNTPTAGNFTIDMRSIVVTDLEAGNGKENLENHLKGTVEGKEGDFFNVNKYPMATFEITRVEGDASNATVHGNLTIKEKTNAISFPATISQSGTTLSLQSEEFVIDRTKWDVNYGSKSIFDNLGDKFISDDIKLTVSLNAAKK